MDKNGAAPAGDAGPRVVVDFDNEIIEVVGAAEPISWFSGRAPKRPIVVPVARVLAPSVQRSDSVCRQPCRGPQPAVRAPPQSDRPKAAARRTPVAFAFVGSDAGAAEGDRHGQWPGEQPPL